MWAIWMPYNYFSHVSLSEKFLSMSHDSEWKLRAYPRKDNLFETCWAPLHNYCSSKSYLFIWNPCLLINSRISCDKLWLNVKLDSTKVWDFWGKMLRAIKYFREDCDCVAKGLAIVKCGGIW